MNKFFEELGDFIDLYFERIIITVVTLIIFLLIACLPLLIIADLHIKNRALDIYEETGVMITIDSKDLTEMTK